MDMTELIPPNSSSRYANSSCPASLEVDVAINRERINDLERRCDRKEEDIRLLRDVELRNLREKELQPLVAWQNRVIVYLTIIAFIGSLLGPYVIDKFLPK